jgi:hypothetical protein
MPTAKQVTLMGENSRRRRTPQRPLSAPNTHPSRSQPLPRPSERILFDDGLQQLLPLRRPRYAARRVYEAWCDGDCDVWRDGKLVDPDLYQLALVVDVWTDDDGREQVKVWKATDMPMTKDDPEPWEKPFERSRRMGIDQTARRWEISTAGIAALLKEFAPAASPVEVKLVGTSKVQLVDKPAPRIKTQSPAQPTEDQIEKWVNDESVSRTQREIRRFVVKEFGRDWRSVSTATIIKAARESTEFKKRVHPFPSENTFNRALERKES